MSIVRYSLFLAVALSMQVASLSAAEPYAEFLEGLRQREYYDYALLYLEQIEAQQDVPDEVRQLIPYEKAVTLLASVKRVSNPETQNKQLDRALAYLDQFVKESPRHPRAAQANTERARILLGKARVEVWQSRSPTNKEIRDQFQDRARTFVKQAREIFQNAHDGHKANWEAFPKFIDKGLEPKQWDERRAGEVKYMRAQLDLALCTYEDSQTYDEGAEKFKEVLTDASRQFEEIHQKYRSQVVGLYARMWQGKCFEEQDTKESIKIALGIYNELLGHPGTSSVMQRLQDQVRMFRLMCLNHDLRKDYELATLEADEWLSSNRQKQRTSTGLGIRWQLALAQIALAEDRAREDLKDSDRERLLNQALAGVRFINQYPGEYHDVSMFMIRDLQRKIKGDDIDPADFDTALGVGRNMIKSIGPKNDAIKAAKTKDEQADAKEDLNLHLAETSRILELSLTLATDNTSLEDLNQVRYLLSYSEYLQRNSYESAILGEFVARHAGEDNAKTALDAAYLAMAAYVQAYNDSPEDQKPVDMKYMVRICDLITSNWPDSDRANDARMQLGRVYSQMNAPADAAKWYSEIPAKAPQYAEAQTNAGQAYWTAYLEAANAPEGERPAPDQLKEWQAQADQHLRNGIQKLTEQTPADGKPPAELIAAKVSLAQIIIPTGKYQEAIDLIIKEPHAVETAISVGKEETRPKKGVTSSEFASVSYQLLLRCYVGIQDLDKARSTMTKLEVVAEGSGGSEAVTAIYVSLGKKLEEELKTLKGLGDQSRVAAVRTSFETFLDDLFKRENQTYGSLVWIAETYYGLATGSEGEPAQSEKYFERAAATYQTIIDRVAAEPDWVDETRLSGIKLRLVNCRRRQGSYEQALDLVTEIITEKPKALDAQIEAAYVLQDWAGSGVGSSHEKYLEAINGRSVGENVPLWGWGQIAMRLQRLLFAGNAESKEKYGDRYLESRYNIPYCRHQFGMAQTKTELRNKALETAEAEITAFVAITAEIPDKWWDELDELYQQIQRDAGKATVAKLERPEVIEDAPPPKPEADTALAKGPAVKPKPTEPKPPEPSGLGWVWGVLGLVLAGGAAYGFYYLSASNDKKRRAAYVTAPAAVAMPQRRAAAKTKTRAPQARKPKPQAKATGKSPSAGAKKPAAKPNRTKPSKPE